MTDRRVRHRQLHRGSPCAPSSVIRGGGRRNSPACYQALTEMTREDAQVNFVAVANHAQVSTDFPYRHPHFRDQVTALQKARGRPTPPTATDDMGEDATSSGARALAGQLREAKASHCTEAGVAEGTGRCGRRESQPATATSGVGEVT